MAITATPRKVTSAEQTLMRRAGQWCELSAAIDAPATVLTALLDLDSLPDSNDEVAEIDVAGDYYGDYTSAYAGMTIYIGSTVGASDLGVCRLRKDLGTLSSSHFTMYIGETSDIDWIVDPQVDRYITIVDEFRIWPRLVRTVGPTTTAISGDMLYTANTMKVYGDRDRVFGFYVYTEPNTSTVYLERHAGFTYGYIDLFVAGDYVTIGGGGERHKVITVVDADHMTIDAPFATWPSAFFAEAYPIKTRFLTEVEPGDFLNMGAVTAEVTSIVSDVELNVRAAFATSAIGQTATRTRLKVYMDYDVSVVDSEYSDQNNQSTYPYPPVPILGGPIVIDNYENNPIVVQLDASASYQIGATVASYLWTATGGALSDDDIANPALTIDAAGVYRYTCKLIGSGGVGRPSYGHRKIYVYDRTHPPFSLMKIDSLSGDASNGWNARITVYGDASTTQIRDQAEVVIFARDHYGATRQSIGQLTRSQNVVMVGRIVGETIDIDQELGTVSFEIQGPLYWLDAITGVPTGMEDVSASPTVWTQFYQLTVDRMLWHLLMWRSMLTLSCDLYLTGDTRRLSFLEGKLGSLSSQVEQIARQVILSRASSDRYGRVVIEIDPQMIPSAARTTPNVQHFAMQDMVAGSINIQRRTVNAVASMTVSGTSWNGSTGSAYTKTLPGGVFKTHGRIDSISNLAIANQTQCDNLAALAMANRNNPYPQVSFDIGAINRLIDVAPAMYVTLDASDNIRALDLDRLPVMVKRVSHSYDPVSGVLSTNISGEGYTDETTRIEGAPPDMPFSF
jgi:hypothetical protein